VVWVEVAKLAIAPAFVAVVTLIGRRFGASVAGFLAALPVVAGPILGLLVAAHGPIFGATAALGCAIGTAPTMLFALSFARLAPRLPPLACLCASYAAYFASAALAYFIPVSWPFAIAVPLVSWLVMLPAFPVHDVRLARTPAGRWDLPMRITATFLMVATITGLARVLGPRIAGLLTPIPIITATLAVFSHQQGGAVTAAILLRALVRGIASFVAFFWVAAALLPSFGLFGAFACALAVCLLMHVLIQRFDVGAPPVESSALPANVR
jgi:hypothetical protein